MNYWGIGVLHMIRVLERIRAQELPTLFRWFIIYSLMGWIFETTFCYITSGNLTKRGFLYGPLIPIYGCCVLIMILVCYNKEDSIISLFVRCAIVATTVEYMTSFWMERIFDRRWWNYSNIPMNIHGRICLGASVLFGILGALLIRYVHPRVMLMSEHISDRALSFFDRAILVIFLYDILLSVRVTII